MRPEISELLDELEASPAPTLDWAGTRKRIHELHRRSESFEERGLLLKIYVTLMNSVEKMNLTTDIEEFRKSYRQDYNLFVLSEGTDEKGNIDPKKFLTVTQREVAAGHMSESDDMRQLAISGQVFDKKPDLPKVPPPKGILDRVRHWFAFRRSGWQATLREHTKKMFAASLLRDFSEGKKREIEEAFFAEVMDIDRQPDPFMAFRERFAAAAMSYAQLEVLTLKPDELVDMFVSPYISGELHTRIRDMGKHDEWIGNLCARPDADDEAIYTAIQAQAVINLLYMNGYNLLRAKYEPWSVGEKPEWFRPFVRSMMIWAESNHRTTLGMPQLCKDVLAIQHSTFANVVRNCERHPLSAWEALHRVSMPTLANLREVGHE